MRRLDRQLTWVSIILVVYLLANVVLPNNTGEK